MMPHYRQFFTEGRGKYHCLQAGGMENLDFFLFDNLGETALRAFPGDSEARQKRDFTAELAARDFMPFGNLSCPFRIGPLRSSKVHVRTLIGQLFHEGKSANFAAV